MGIVNDIKKTALGNRTKIQGSEAAELDKVFNNVFYLPHDIDEETKFVRHVMTRGAETQERKGLHASNMLVGERDYCPRALVLSLVYKQAQGSEVNPSLKRIFEEGNAIHEKWQRLFIRAGFGCAEDMDKTRWHEPYKMSYSPDAIITVDSFYDDPMVVEIKSVNTFQFKKMMKHPSAWKQCQWYMHLTGLKKGIVLSEDKNTQEYKIEVYDYDEDLVLPFIARAEEVMYHYGRLIEDRKMVKRPRQATDVDCKLCDNCVMKEACWNVGMGRVRLDEGGEDGH